MRVIGYGRISRTKDGDDAISLEIQKHDYLSWVERGKHEDAGWYQDANISGKYGPEKRPGLAKALDACDGETVLVARDLTRLGRSVNLLAVLNQAMENGRLKGIETTHGQTIGAGYQGRQLLGLMLVIGQGEREAASERIRRRQARDRALGKPHGGGAIPFGMMEDRTTQNPEQVAILERICDDVLAGRSLSSIAKDLNTAGVPSPTGKAVWRYQTMRAMLLRDRMMSLLGEERTRMMQQAIRARTSTAPASRAFTRWLNGCLQCGACGVLLDSHSYNGKPAYGCSREEGCARVWVGAELVEDLFHGFVRQVTLSWQDNTTAEHRELLEQRTDVAEKIERLLEMRRDGDVTIAQMRKWRAPLEENLAALDARLLSLSATSALRGKLELWDSMDARQRRSVVLDVTEGQQFIVKQAKGSRDAKGRTYFDVRRFDPPPHLRTMWKGYLATR